MECLWPKKCYTSVDIQERFKPLRNVSPMTIVQLDDALCTYLNLPFDHPERRFLVKNKDDKDVYQILKDHVPTWKHYCTLRTPICVGCLKILPTLIFLGTTQCKQIRYFQLSCDKVINLTCKLPLYWYVSLESFREKVKLYAVSQYRLSDEAKWIPCSANLRQVMQHTKKQEKYKPERIGNKI